MRRNTLYFGLFLLVLSSLLVPLGMLAKFSNHIAASGLDYMQADLKSTKHGGAAAVDVNGDGSTDILVARDGRTPLYL